ncbi:MAG: PHP domain-containing protein [Spirochaetaceae bacterium]|jgi:predicted metal-dependent phosphoesterase TrpH|nr:PHP domain-containing protein [Spirochaetaceae bacterium]
MGFIYETHLHTRQASVCGVSRGADYVRRYLDAGFTGIMVTDHFFNSNTPLDRRQPWSEWVNGFCSGYEDARNEGEKRGLDVFFGWEETFDGDDYLVYGLDKAWLLEHPEMIRWTRKEQAREVRRSGGCVVHAHPFRQHSYIDAIHLAPHFVDAIEAANKGNHDAIYDAQALEYARILGLPAVAGSDIHNAKDLPGQAPFGIEVETKLASIADYAALILNRGTIKLRMPPGRCDFRRTGDKPLLLPVEIRDRNDRTPGPRRMTFNEAAEQLAFSAVEKKAG